MLGDYEESAIRPHALGSFRDLLGADRAPPGDAAYLDNAQNAANRINENYARELMELHTLGVRRRLHAARRAGAGAHAHRRGRELRRSAARAAGCSRYVRTALRVQSQPPRLRRQDAARPADPRPRPGRARRGARPPARHRQPRASSRASSPCTSSPTIRRRRWSSAWRAAFRAATAISPPRCARCSRRPNSRLARRQVQGPAALRGLGVRVSRTTTASIAQSGRRCSAGSTAWASRCMAARRPTAIRSREPAWASPGQMTTRFEIARAIGAAAGSSAPTALAGSAASRSWPTRSSWIARRRAARRARRSAGELAAGVERAPARHRPNS